MFTAFFMSKNKKESNLMLLSFGRDEATRTPDPYVPNVVRYQLRYIPIFGATKVETFLVLYKKRC